MFVVGVAGDPALPAALEAGLMGVGVVDAPLDDGKMVDRGLVPDALGVSARGLIAGAGATVLGATASINSIR